MHTAQDDQPVNYSVKGSGNGTDDFTIAAFKEFGILLGGLQREKQCESFI